MTWEGCGRRKHEIRNSRVLFIDVAKGNTLRCLTNDAHIMSSFVRKHLQKNPEKRQQNIYSFSIRNFCDILQTKFRVASERRDNLNFRFQLRFLFNFQFFFQFNFQHPFLLHFPLPNYRKSSKVLVYDFSLLCCCFLSPC